MEEPHFNMKFLTKSIYKQMMGLHEPSTCCSAVKISPNQLAIFHNRKHNIEYKRAKLVADSRARWYWLTAPL